MLSALAATNPTPGSSSHNVDEELRAVPSSLPLVESSGVPAPSSSASGIRRSLRLSAKNGGVPTGATNGNSTTDSAAAEPSEGSVSAAPSLQRPMFNSSGDTPSTEGAPSDTVVDSEIHADFTDDEVDAEVLISMLLVTLIKLEISGF
jgi:E3 ubiquitin-protein ligase TRIP12